MQQTDFSFKSRYFILPFALLALAGTFPTVGKAPEPASTPIPAPEAAFTPLSEAEKTALIARLKSESGSVKGIRCQFVQTSASAMLVKPEVSRGTLSFVKPMSFRYEYENGNIFTLEQGTFTYLLPAQKQAGKLDLRRYDRLLGKYGDPLAIVDHIGTEYEILEAGKSGERYRLKLSPGAKGKRGPMSTVTLEFTGAPLAMSMLSVAMKNGDSLSLAFSHTELNPALPKDVFSVKIPAGVALKESLPSGLNF
jgi:outer membrane lipoprotein-sorting protein